MKEEKRRYPSGIKEIARRSGVSIGTVDRVIHGRPGVSPKTKEKVDAIIDELGYQPNLVARRLASKRFIRIGTLTPKVPGETVYWEAILNGITQAEAEMEDYGVIVEKYFFDQNDKRSFVLQAEVLLSSGVDGIVLTPIFIEESTDLARMCQKENIPFVFINSDLPSVQSLCYIGPNLFQSGYLAAHLIGYLTRSGDKVMVLNISRELEQFHYTLRKEEGFRDYCGKFLTGLRIVKADIRQTDYDSIKREVGQLLQEHEDTKVIFVTNSRVSTVAQYLSTLDDKPSILIGYDFLPDNIKHLEKGTIDFLICQKPQEQSYQGMMTLYQHLAFLTEVEPVNFMPIDIITRENYTSYKN